MSCTNRGKRLPIDHLGDIVCPHDQGISRQTMEARVLAVFPDSLFSVVKIEELQGSLNKVIEARSRERGRVAERLRAELARTEQQQQGALEMVLDRKLAGQSLLPALDQKIDKLETLRLELQAQLDNLPVTSKEELPTGNRSIACMLHAAISAICKAAGSDGSDRREDDISCAQPYPEGPDPSVRVRGRPDLEVHGRLSSILAALEAWAAEEKRLKQEGREEYNRKRSDGTFRNGEDRIA